MADKQTGTGARGTGHKQAEGRSESTKNAVSAKNRSQQKRAVNRSTPKDPVRGKRERD